MSDLNNTQPFNPAVPSRVYSANQWITKEDWYAYECASIVISDTPSPAEIQQIAAKIDALLTLARIDYAYVNQTYDKYNMQLKIEEKRLFVELKINPPAKFNTLKLTVEEMKGIVTNVIQNQPWENTQYSLYQLVEMASKRNIFMEGVIKILQDKKDLLITHSGMLKIENSLNSLQHNTAPNYNQHQGYKHSMEEQ